MTPETAAEVQHLTNPTLGWLRLAFHAQTGTDPSKVTYDADGLPETNGLPDTITLDTRLAVGIVRRLEEVLALAKASGSVAHRPGAPVPGVLADSPRLSQTLSRTLSDPCPGSLTK